MLLATPLSCLATDYPPPPGSYPVGPLDVVITSPAPDLVTGAPLSGTRPGTTGPHMIDLANDDFGSTTNPYDPSVLFGAPPRAAAQTEQLAVEPPATMMPPAMPDYGYADPAPPQFANERGFSMDFSRDSRQANPGGYFEQPAPPYADYPSTQAPAMNYDSRAAAMAHPGYDPGYGGQYSPGQGYDYGSDYTGGPPPRHVDPGYVDQDYSGGYAGYQEGYYAPGYTAPPAQPDRPLATMPGAPTAGETSVAAPDSRFRPPELLPQ